MRSAVAAAGAAIFSAVLAASAAGAQEDVIKRRQVAMKSMGEQSDAGAAMLKGQVPFDAQKAAVVFSTFKTAMSNFTTLFPDGSDVGGTKATPAVWRDRKGFEAAAAAFDKAVADNAAKATTAEGFKAAFMAAAGECRSCHQGFKSR